MTHTTKGSIFNDLGFEQAEAEHLKIRASLMRAIEKYIVDQKLTQKEAAKLMGVYQPRISDLLHGKIHKFTIDMLVNMLAKAHIGVAITINSKLAA